MNKVTPIPLGILRATASLALVLVLVFSSACGGGFESSSEPGQGDAVIGQARQALSLTIPVLIDTEARAESPDSNHGTTATVSADNSPAIEAFLKFNVQGINGGVVTSALLKCYVSNATGNGPAIYGVVNTWTETGLTWNNRPAANTAELDDVASVTAGTWATWDVTGHVAGDALRSFVLKSSSTDGFGCSSREGAHPPTLEITYLPAAYDLIVTNVSWTPAAPVPGDSIVFSATLKNAGSVATPAGAQHTVHFLLDDDTIASTWSTTYTQSIAPGESVTVTANGGQGGLKYWVGTAGPHTVKAWANKLGPLPDESDTSNNTFIESFNVGAAAYDLVVSDITYTPASPVTGSAVVFSARLTNQGTAATPDGLAHVVNFFLDGSTTSTSWSTNHTASIPAGGSVVVVATGGQGGNAWTATAGTHTVLAWVNKGLALPDESDTSNNDDHSETFTVGATSTCNLGDMVVGDTVPCTQIVYPAEAYSAGGGRVLDVKTQFGAKGDGVTDDTAALRKAYQYVFNQLQVVGWNGFFQNNNKASFILYFPNGTYLVKDTIIYTATQKMIAVNSEALAQIRFVGQDRARTILRLAPNSPGFNDPSVPKPVLSFGKHHFNNTPASNSLRNLTIKIGSGNSGAIGVNFGGANQSDIQNLAIISEDGDGFVGLDNSIGTVLSYQRDITVEGFRYGVRMVPYHFTEPVIEHLTLKNQTVAGVLFVNGTGSLRKVKSVNTVPAVLISDAGAHAVIIDSSLTGGAPTESAIKLVSGANGLGHAFARNITVGGYGCGFKKGATCLSGCSGTFTGQCLSDTPIRFSTTRPSSASSLNLPIEEVPFVPLDPVSQWARPLAYDANAGGDATAKIQAAVNTGASTLYFPLYRYVINGTITVPCSVKRITGLFTSWEGTGNPKFDVSANCTDPLIIEDGSFDGSGLAIRQSSMRTVILQRIDTQAPLFDSTVATSVGRPKAFLNMVGQIKASRPFSNVKAFLRTFNAESTIGSLVADSNSIVWAMGFKTEKDQTALQVRNGGQLEVLGGIINQYCQAGACAWGTTQSAPAAVEVYGSASKASIVAATNGPSSTTQHFTTIIRDTQGATVNSWYWNTATLPDRVGRDGQEIIPLYVSY